jgi:hypothetical protein
MQSILNEKEFQDIENPIENIKDAEGLEETITKLYRMSVVPNFEK